MASGVKKGLDLKEERRRLIEDMVAEHGPEWSKPYQPGTFGCHELLDRTSLVAEAVEREILSHPACIQNQGWFALAETAVSALQELYQQIGKAHLDDDPATHDGSRSTREA